MDRLNIKIKKRKKHPIKEIEQLVKEAEEVGWKLKPAGKSGHSWGKLKCPEPDGCQISIWSTPSNIGLSCRQIKSAIRNCKHLST